MTSYIKIMMLVFALSIPNIALSQTSDVPPWVQDEIDDPTPPEEIEAIRKKRKEQAKISSYVFIPSTDVIMMGGLSIEMTLNQMERTLTAKGYECITASVLAQAAYMDVTISEMTIDKQSKFCFPKETQATHTRISNDKIFLPCSYFNVCGQGIQELAQSLIDQDKVDRLIYDLDRKGQVIVAKYCGSGPEGDRICVVDETYENRSSIYFELMKGDYGRGGRRFD